MKTKQTLFVLLDFLFRQFPHIKLKQMTLEQQVHQNDVKLHKLIREVEELKKIISLLKNDIKEIEEILYHFPNPKNK